MNMKWLQNQGAMQRNLIGGGLVLVVLLVAAKFLVMPKLDALGTLETDLAQLSGEVTIYQAKAAQLDVLKVENKRLQRLLIEQQQQLPNRHEVSSLLKQVTDLGARSGLIFSLWRPDAAHVNRSGLYQELPVSVEVSGSYHQVGVFFEQVGKLNRIVNISGVRMTPNPTSDQLTTSFTATAFAAVDAATQAQLKAEKGKQ